ncbi:hypothetical protein G9A89_007700 [Geosiphon pyriformis]|nr:hypothetical protein G9A89_007700 [Geosiphon pyriformis]
MGKFRLRQSQRPKNIKLIAIAVTRTEINTISQVGNRDLDDTCVAISTGKTLTGGYPACPLYTSIYLTRDSQIRI